MILVGQSTLAQHMPANKAFILLVVGANNRLSWLLQAGLSSWTSYRSVG